MLTPGEAHDVHGFGPLFRMITGKVKALLADRGYDADAIRTEIALHGIQAQFIARVIDGLRRAAEQIAAACVG